MGALDLVEELRQTRKLDSSIPPGLARIAESTRSASAVAAYTALAEDNFLLVLKALDEIAWPLKDRQECAGVTVLLKTTEDLQKIAEEALAAVAEAVQEALK